MDLKQAEIHRVAPAPVPPGAPPGQWQCAACGEPYLVHQGFKVLYDTPEGARCIAFVCPDCAASANAEAG